MLKWLKLKYGFEDWHANNPPSCRPYKKFVADIINKESPKVVVEVGCGLGDILNLIHADTKYGIDHSPEVIAAAQSIDRESTFLHGGFEKLGQIEDSEIDYVIVIGCLHYFSPSDLSKNLVPHLNKVKFLVLDQFALNQAPVPGNNCPPYIHDFKFLDNIAR